MPLARHYSGLVRRNVDSLSQTALASDSKGEALSSKETQTEQINTGAQSGLWNSDSRTEENLGPLPVYHILKADFQAKFTSIWIKKRLPRVLQEILTVETNISFPLTFNHLDPTWLTPQGYQEGWPLATQYPVLMASPCSFHVDFITYRCRLQSSYSGNDFILSTYAR
jgi:hypothetical protein